MKTSDQGLVILLFIIAVIIDAAVFAAEFTVPNHNKEFEAQQRTAAAQACSQAGGILMFEYADGEMRFKTCTFVPGAVRQ